MDMDFEYKESLFLEIDERRCKKIKSLKKDVFAHFKHIRGKIWEQRNVPQYFVPEKKTCFLSKTVGDLHIRICKFRQVTTNPRSSKSDGLRIISIIAFTTNGNPKSYTPLFVYSAKEEKTKITCCGSQYPVSKTGIQRMIKHRLDDH